MNKINRILKTSLLLMLALTPLIAMAEASTLQIRSLYVKSMGDGYISVAVGLQYNGTFGVSIDNNEVWRETVDDHTAGSGSEFPISSGKHDICAYNVGNKENMTTCTSFTMQTSVTDTEPPQISRVELSNSMLSVGDILDIKVIVNDNVGVAGVTVNDAECSPLFRTKDGNGNTWTTRITSTEGSHAVYVVAYDEAGNKDMDNTQKYIVSPKITLSTPTSALNLTQNVSSTPTPTQTPSTKLNLSNSIDTYGRLNIDSDPSGAEIYIDNVQYSSAPYSLKILTGSHAVRLTKENYKDFTKMVSVSENVEITISAKLIPLNETSNTENNQTNQSAMIDNGNSKQQNNGDSTTSLLNNLVILAGIVFIGATVIIYRILTPQKNTYVNYNMMPTQTTNEKSMIVLKRVDDRR